MRGSLERLRRLSAQRALNKPLATIVGLMLRDCLWLTVCLLFLVNALITVVEVVADTVVVVVVAWISCQ